MITQSDIDFALVAWQNAYDALLVATDKLNNWINLPSEIKYYNACVAQEAAAKTYYDQLVATYAAQQQGIFEPTVPGSSFGTGLIAVVVVGSLGILLVYKMLKRK